MSGFKASRSDVLNDTRHAFSPRRARAHKQNPVAVLGEAKSGMPDELQYTVALFRSNIAESALISAA